MEIYFYFQCDEAVSPLRGQVRDVEPYVPLGNVRIRVTGHLCRS